MDMANTTTHNTIKCSTTQVTIGLSADHTVKEDCVRGVSSCQSKPQSTYLQEDIRCCIPYPQQH